MLCLLLWTGSVGGGFSVYIMLWPVSPCLREVVLPPLCVRPCIMVTVWGSIGWLLASFDLFCSLISCFLQVCLLLSLVVLFGSTFGALSESAALVSCALCVSVFAVFILVTCSWVTCSCASDSAVLTLLCLGSGSSYGLGFKDHIVGLGHRCGARLDGLWTRGWASFWWPHTDELGKTWRGVEPLDVLAAVVVSSQPFTISRSLLKFLSERGARSKSICCKSEDPLRWDSRWFPSSVAAFFGKSLTSRLRSYMLKEARMESFMVFLISSRRLVRKLLTRSSSSWGHSNSLFASPSRDESSTGSGGDAERGSLLAASTLPWRALSFSWSRLLRNQSQSFFFESWKSKCCICIKNAIGKLASK